MEDSSVAIIDTARQQARFLPHIVDVTELWAQGYSSPVRPVTSPASPPRPSSATAGG